MANTLYDQGRMLFLQGAIDWRDANVKCCLVDTSAGHYSFSPSHQFFDVVNVGGNVVGTPPAIRPLVWTGAGAPMRPTTLGAADADDVTFPAVSGASIEAIVIYEDSGDPASSPLIAYIDTATGLPITPNGGDIIVTWDNGTNKIFRL